MTTTAARAADVQARIFFLLLRLPPAGVVALGVVASAFGAAGIVPIGCCWAGSSGFWAGSSGFCAGSSGGALCWGELASPYCSGPTALPSAAACRYQPVAAGEHILKRIADSFEYRRKLATAAVGTE